MFSCIDDTDLLYTVFCPAKKFSIYVINSAHNFVTVPLQAFTSADRQRTSPGRAVHCVVNIVMCFVQ